jgi:hypothetical protein
VGHPNVCHVYEFYDARTADGVAVHFLTMELLDGETLAHQLRERGRMSTAEALPLVLQMCEGLAAAHAEGVVHRDFKSSNVLLVHRRGTAADSGSIRAVITDFGIARPLESSGEPGLTAGAGMIGTPEYMAPEQVTGGAVTPCTDLFALGVVMYEMVTGELPFTGETPLATAAKRIQEAPRPPETLLPGLDPRWSQVILRCLAREPERRFRSAEELRAALLAPPRHPVRRAGLIAAGVLALAAIVVGGSLYARREAKVRWARDIALPRVAELVELNKYPEAMALAEQVQTVLPEVSEAQEAPSGDVAAGQRGDDAGRRDRRGEAVRLAGHRMAATRGVPRSARSASPSGSICGASPRQGTSRWSARSPRSTPRERSPFACRSTASAASRRTWCASRAEAWGWGSRGSTTSRRVVLGDYLIDRTEVTNRQFKRFVDEGGYRRRELWKEPFVHSREDARLGPGDGAPARSNGSSGPGHVGARRLPPTGRPIIRSPGSAGTRPRPTPPSSASSSPTRTSGATPPGRT